jgi:hypothetical protein
MGILGAPANLPFTIALAIVGLLGALEVLSLMLGGAVSVMGGDMDADIDADVDADGAWGEFLSWLQVGQIPSMILLITFLLSFGIAGLLLQTLLKSATGAMMPLPISLLPAFLVALPGTRLAGGILKKVLPRDESESVSRDSFLGCGGEITVGTARRGHPAEARVRDAFGRTHYVMVEPDNEEQTFPAGSKVVLLKRHEAIYRVIDDVHVPLEDS